LRCKMHVHTVLKTAMGGRSAAAAACDACRAADGVPPHAKVLLVKTARAAALAQAMSR